MDEKNKLTIYDIAQIADVSEATVSRVLNHPDRVAADTYSQVMDVIKRKGYHPNFFAQAMATQRSRFIALIIPFSEFDFTSNPYYMELLRGISNVLSGHDYFAIYCFKYSRNSTSIV